MRTALTTLVALASTASATFNWNGASPFSCPANTNNHCIPSQSGGFSWSGLNLGDFSSFGGFDFEGGWSCKSSFGGSKKRDQLTGRTFQDKCIAAPASHDVSSSPSFGCGSNKDVDKFSVDEFQISVEFDCDLEFHYGMSDGSTCKQTSSCSSHGTTVKNSQCGGAKNVTVVYPSGGRNPPSKPTCSVGIHSIGFDCSTASSTVPHTSTKPPTYSATSPPVYTATTTPLSSPPASSSVATYTPSTIETTPISSPTGETTSEVSTTYIQTTPEVPTTTPEASTTYEAPSSTPEVPTTTPEASTTYIQTTPEVPATTPETSTYVIPTTIPAGNFSSSIFTTPETTPESSPAPTSSAAGSTTTPEEFTTTVVIETSVTVCPVTLTHTSEGTTSIETGSTTSTILITATYTTPAVATSTPVGEVTTTSSSTGPAPTAPCPEVLPQCLSTWMFSAGCGSNADASCYCPSSEFVCNVFECLSAHGASDSEVASAQSYFQGICAPHVGSNPAIITCAPTVTGTTTAAGVPIPTDVPVTTISVLTTIVVPYTQSGTTIPGSSTESVLSTYLTVPQVIFQTITGTATGTATPSAELVVGTPAPASVAAGVTTAPLPAATTISTVAVGGLGSNSTATYSSSPAAFTGASSRTTATFGTLFAAVLLAAFSM